jgi:hypothetical protein
VVTTIGGNVTLMQSIKLMLLLKSTVEPTMRSSRNGSTSVELSISGPLNSPSKAPDGSGERSEPRFQVLP